MDVDATVTSDINAIAGRGQQHSEAKKAELMRSNLCFYCEIKGHRAKDCHKKQADRSNFRVVPITPGNLLGFMLHPLCQTSRILTVLLTF